MHNEWKDTRDFVPGNFIHIIVTYCFLNTKLGPFFYLTLGRDM